MERRLTPEVESNGYEIIQPAVVEAFLGMSEEARQRQTLYREMGRVFDENPIEGTQIECDPLLQQLADFLASDPNNARLVLYLPFQLLPQVGDQNLTPAKLAFVDEYMDGWRSLLSENDARANFVDGDILETELGRGGTEWIKKAAHLAPILIKKGMLDSEEIEEILENTQDPILRQSLTDAATQVVSEKMVQTPYEKKATSIKGGPFIIDLRSKLAYEMTRLDRWYDTAKSLPQGYTNSRFLWEKQDKTDNVIEKYAEYVAHHLAQKDIRIDDLSLLLSLTQNDVASSRVVTQAINKSQNPEYLSILEKIWENGEPQVKKEVATTLYHFVDKGLISSTILEEYGLRPAQIDAINPVSVNEMEEHDLSQLRKIIDKISVEPQLSELFYPSLLFFGSKFKGYGTSDSDIDIAIFIKPTVDRVKRQEVRERLTNLMSDTHNIDKIIEFWLKEEGGVTKIEDRDMEGDIVGESDWAHVILGGMWYGKSESVNDLYSKIVPGYLAADPLHIGAEGVTQEEVRAYYLRQIERETLQYRLMHKGYSRFYSKRDIGIVENSQIVDGESDFYDPGFRRIASRLFVSKVFLPTSA